MLYGVADEVTDVRSGSRLPRGSGAMGYPLWPMALIMHSLPLHREISEDLMRNPYGSQKWQHQFHEVVEEIAKVVRISTSSVIGGRVKQHRQGPDKTAATGDCGQPWSCAGWIVRRPATPASFSVH
jgi:hypothetical protein